MRIKLILVVSAALVIAGCASTHEKFYQQFNNPNDQEFLRLTGTQEVRLIRVENLQEGIKEYASKNYAVIGQSAFNGGYEDEQRIRDLAKKLGTPIVLFHIKYTNTNTATVPLVMPNTSTTYNSGMLSGYGGFGTYSGSSTTYGSTIVPMTTSQQRYDQVAVYLMPRKTKPRLGISFRNLSVEERKKNERNSGVVVVGVVEDTPAFRSNVIDGDLIVSIEGMDVISETGFKKQIDAIPRGPRVVPLEVIRNGTKKSLSIKFE